MTSSRPRNGEVFRYSYLWRRESERGEDAGRKIRPVCLSVLLGDDAGKTRVALFPITSQPPSKERAFLQIPETELKRLGLREPAWVILDECNLDIWEASFHIADRRPLGRISYALFERIRAVALEQLRAGLLGQIPRR